MENWSRSYKIVVGVPEYESDKFLTNLTRIVQAGVKTFTEFDDTTEPLGSRVLSNLESEGQNKRGFTFKLDTSRTVAPTSNNNTEKTTLELYNLDQDLLTVLNKKGCIVRVFAGYQDKVELAYAGEVAQVMPVGAGVDNIYRVKCVDGLSSLKNAIGTLSYDESLSVKDVILDLANRFPDAAVTATGLAKLSSKFITGGLGFTGTVSSSFNMMLRRYNLSCGRFNGKMVIIPHQIEAGDENSKEFSDKNYILTPDLIKGVQPSNNNGQKTTADTKELSGVTMNTFFIPIELGQFFTIPEEATKAYAGTYQATRVRTKLESQGKAWDVVVTGTKIQ